MFGYASMEECRRKLVDFADTFEVRPLNEDRPLPVADWPMSLVMRGEVLRDWEVRLRRLDQGWEKIFAYSGWIIRSASGEMLVFVSVTDITERRRAEEELRRSEQRYKTLNRELEARVRERTAELERKNRELQEFAFVASHDLNEPLRKIQTFSSLLAQKSARYLGESEKDYISRMAGAAQRMQQLLAALLNYSRIDTKGEPFRPTPLGEVVRDAISDLEVTIRDNGAQVMVGLLPTVTGDPNQLRQLFQNLVENAVKYHSHEVKPLIRVHGEENNGDCRIFVEDNGIGFDEKYLDKIFQPFQRLHGRNEYQGTGIGLAICKKIVERHGGTITAKSTLGKGSTFIVTLPAEKQNEFN